MLFLSDCVGSDVEVACLKPEKGTVNAALSLVKLLIFVNNNYKKKQNDDENFLAMCLMTFPFNLYRW